MIKDIRLRRSGQVVCPDWLFMERFSPSIVITLIRIGVIGKREVVG